MRPSRALRASRRRLVAGSIFVALAVTILMGAVTALAGPTRGPIPPAAFPPGGGVIDRSLVPDFIPALGRSGESVGWVSKDLAVPVEDHGDRQLIPVYGDDLTTVVGHMVGGYGFAPIGTDLKPLLDAIPTAPLPDKSDN